MIHYSAPDFHTPLKAEDRCSVCGGYKGIDPHVDPRDPTTMHAPGLVARLRAMWTSTDAQADGAR